MKQKFTYNDGDRHPVDIHIGGRIRAARLALDMSLRALAEPLGITFQQLQKYEKGANRVSASRLAQLGAALDRTPAWFFEGAPGVNGNGAAPPAVDPVHGLAFTSGGQNLAAAYVAIESPLTRAAIVALVEIMAGMRHHGETKS